MTLEIVETLLADLGERSIELQVQGDELRFRPRKAMTPDLLQRLTVHKPQLMARLLPWNQAAADALVAAVLRRFDTDDDWPQEADKRRNVGLLMDQVDRCYSLRDLAGMRMAVSKLGVFVSPTPSSFAALCPVTVALTDYERESYLERLAICTEDGGLSEVQAERVAWEQVAADRQRACRT